MIEDHGSHPGGDQPGSQGAQQAPDGCGFDLQQPQPHQPEHGEEPGYGLQREQLHADIAIGRVHRAIVVQVHTAVGRITVIQSDDHHHQPQQQNRAAADGANQIDGI